MDIFSSEKWTFELGFGQAAFEKAARWLSLRTGLVGMQESSTRRASAGWRAGREEPKAWRAALD